MAHTSVAAAAKQIRTELKALGYSSKQVSVRSDSYSMDSSICVRVLSANVDMAKVKEIATAQQSVRHCETTGEILSGGNRFVDCEFHSDLKNATAALILPIMPTEASRSVCFGPYTIFVDDKSPAHSRFVAYIPGGSPMDSHHCWTADELAHRLARAWLASGEDWAVS